eukprot:TRINITY_DN13147_c0_g1_i1.p1 TRINITY_DN13147_c0_g1~~TRINITY_DN13147_c0_g1_i1.p1  ORF type:complete len:169 (-),score=52.33 TRINITY_DN13147_c0_g1_i1:13-519(-)
MPSESKKRKSVSKEDNPPAKKNKKSTEEKSPSKETPPTLHKSPIAFPLADDKLTEKLFKLVQKTTKAKGIKRGVKEATKSIRKGEKGLCLLAGDVSPLDVISHVPVFCEEKEIPYTFVPSKDALGEASLSKRPTTVIFVLLSKLAASSKEKALYDKCCKKVKKLHEKK